MIRRAALAFWIIFALGFPAFAVNPSEMLANPVLEARARDISRNLRCLVCQNQSIDDSDADLAHDLRVLVRERLTAGDTNAQAVQYIVDRYGEFVLLKPRFVLHNLVLWIAAPTIFLLGLIALIFKIRGNRLPGPVAELSDAEQRALAELRDSGN